MKFRTTIDFDTETGDYNIKFNNLSNPGDPMNLSEVQECVALVIKDWYLQLEDADEFPEGIYELKN